MIGLPGCIILILVVLVNVVSASAAFSSAQTTTTTRQQPQSATPTAGSSSSAAVSLSRTRQGIFHDPRYSTPRATSTRTSTCLSMAVSLQQTAVLDGAEWASIQRFLMAQESTASNDNRKPTATGVISVAVGTTEAGDRVVGSVVVGGGSDDATTTDTTKLSDTVFLHTDSVAAVPTVDGATAISTYIASIVWHVSWKQAITDNTKGKGIGGSTTPEDIKAVVVGGSPYAASAAAAYAALGATTTTLVTTNKSIKASSNDNVTVMAPSSGDLELGFAQVLGTFDILLDTVANERDDDFDNEDDSNAAVFRNSVLRYLQQRHYCRSYVSTVTTAQTILGKRGVLWGPKEANAYVKEQTKIAAAASSFVPPRSFGETVETILKAGVTVKPAKQKQAVRGWSLQEYWELSTWPRDAAGGANVRYGFPVPEDLDSSLEDTDDFVLIAEPPLRSVGRTTEEELAPNETPEGANPYIQNVEGVQGLQSQIIAPEKDVLLFLSAPFCRTCRYLQPQYQRLARLKTDELNGAVTFCKAEAVGQAGKELGRALSVDAVPSFLLFRKGKLFGEPLSLTRLPSAKLTLAIELLEAGKAWDEQALRDVDSRGSKR